VENEEDGPSSGSKSYDKNNQFVMTVSSMNNASLLDMDDIDD